MTLTAPVYAAVLKHGSVKNNCLHPSFHITEDFVEPTLVIVVIIPTALAPPLVPKDIWSLIFLFGAMKLNLMS